MKKKLLIAAGVVVLLLVIAVAGITLYIRGWYRRLVEDHPVVTPVQVAPARADEVNRRIDGLDRALRRGETVEAEFDNEEINIAISTRDHLEPWREQIRIKKIEGDLLTLEASVPIEEDGAERFLNCEVDAYARVEDGTLEFEVRRARSTDGKALPASLVQMIEDFARKQAESNPDATRELERVERFEVRDGTIYMKIKPRRR